ncbi:MAG: hypothetical protein SCJ97_05765, partial [Bacillota bacterium]|nr:hypothetical protein [Bacillota bacterium]
MKKRTLVAVALAVIFTLALAAPVFAQDMTHSVDYDLDGTISLKKHVGHLCNTGAEMKQVIAGAGTMMKSTDAYMMAGYLTVDDDNDWIASATSSLSVITAIELCAPAKHVYDFPDEPNGEVSAPLSNGNGSDGDVYFDVEDLYDRDDIKPLTKQIWAAEVKADPSFSGNMHTDFTAAYGPGPGDGDDEWGWDEDDEVEVGEDYVGNYFI